MKIAILSDIHGNDIALEAVLSEIVDEGINKIFVLGDVVGYYYHPDKVINALETFDVEYIRGNHEDLLYQAINNGIKAEIIYDKYGSGINFAIEKLSSNNIELFVNLPKCKIVEIDDIQIELCHGSPWNNDYYVYPDAGKKILRKCAFSHCDFILMGHTHRAFTYSFNGSTVANVGSVGQSRDKGGLASWAVIDTNNRSFILRRSKFDVSILCKEVKDIDPHVPYLHEILNR